MSRQHECVKAERSTLGAQCMRRNDRRISTVADRERERERERESKIGIGCWSECGTRTGCSYSSYNVS